MQRPLMPLLLLVLLASAPASADNKLPADIGSKLRDQISGCWNMPAGGATSKVTVRMTLKRDGSIDEQPVIQKPSNEPALASYEQSVLRAMQRCAPYKLLAGHPDSYDDWRELIITFDPADMAFDDKPVGTGTSEKDQSRLKADVEAALEAKIAAEVNAKAKAEAQVKAAAIAKAEAAEAIARAEALNADTLTPVNNVAFRAVAPAGYCRVDAGKDVYDAEYLKGVTEQMKPHNTVIGFWLECDYLKEARAGNMDIGDPKSWIVVQVANTLLGPPTPDMRRRAEMLAAYAKNFHQLGITTSPIAQVVAMMEKQLAEKLGTELQRTEQVVIGPDEFAIYLASTTTRKDEAAGQTTAIAALSGFTLVKTYQVSANAYRPGATSAAFPEMQEQMREMLVSLDELSTFE